MEEVKIKKKESNKTGKEYWIVAIVCIVIGLLALGVGYYFTFAKDDGNNYKTWIDRKGNGKNLTVSINDKNITYKCVSNNCVLLESGENFILVNDNGYYIYDITKKLSLKLDVDNIDDSRVDIIERNSDILGIFYSNTNNYYYSIRETKNYALEYDWANGMIYEMVKDGYYQTYYDGNDMIIDYRNNKKMLSLVGGCDGLSNNYGNLESNSYYYAYNEECGDAKYRQNIYTKDFKKVGNDAIGYYFHDFGMDRNGNYIVSTDLDRNGNYIVSTGLKSFSVINEKGTVISTKEYNEIFDGIYGYFIVNNNGKIQLVNYEGNLIKDFSDNFSGKDLKKLFVGIGPYSYPSFVSYNEKKQRIINFDMVYFIDEPEEDGWWSSEAKTINYKILYNVDSNDVTINKISK